MYPKLEPKKAEICDKFTKKLAGTITSDFSSWNKYMCDSWKSVYLKLIKTYGGGGTAKKDFWFSLLLRTSHPWDSQNSILNDSSNIDVPGKF